MASGLIDDGIARYLSDAPAAGLKDMADAARRRRTGSEAAGDARALDQARLPVKAREAIRRAQGRPEWSNFDGQTRTSIIKGIVERARLEERALAFAEGLSRGTLRNEYRGPGEFKAEPRAKAEQAMTIEATAEEAESAYLGSERRMAATEELKRAGTSQVSRLVSNMIKARPTAPYRGNLAESAAETVGETARTVFLLQTGGVAAMGSFLGATFLTTEGDLKEKALATAQEAAIFAAFGVTGGLGQAAMKKWGTTAAKRTLVRTLEGLGIGVPTYGLEIAAGKDPEEALIAAAAWAVLPQAQRAAIKRAHKKMVNDAFEADVWRGMEESKLEGIDKIRRGEFEWEGEGKKRTEAIKEKDQRDIKDQKDGKRDGREKRCERGGESDAGVFKESL